MSCAAVWQLGQAVAGLAPKMELSKSSPVGPLYHVDDSILPHCMHLSTGFWGAGTVGAWVGKGASVALWSAVSPGLTCAACNVQGRVAQKQ